jgi:hypothetical protein
LNLIAYTNNLIIRRNGSWGWFGFKDTNIISLPKGLKVGFGEDLQKYHTKRIKVDDI